MRGHRAPAGVRGNGYLSVCELAHHAPEVIGSRLAEIGVSTGRVYPSTLDEQPPAAGALRVSSLSRGRAFCRHVINLPLFYGMTDEERAWTARGLSSALAAGD